MLIHLNGIAGFANTPPFNTASVFQPRYNISKDDLLSFTENNNIESNIHFVWESNQYHSPIMKHVSKMIEDTTILVVIGYSFPFFNRQIDKQIFQELKSNQHFKKIYYQDPVLDGNQLISQFNIDEEQTSIVHISQTRNFHIPFEY